MEPYRGKIRNKLVITFVSFVVVAVVGSGWFLYCSTRRALEKQLGTELAAIAGIAANQINGELLLSLSPGDEQSRTYANLQRKLNSIRGSTGARRLYIFDLQNHSLLDTEPQVAIGREYPQLRFNTSELKRVWQGEPSHSTLFKGTDGNFYQSGFAPIELGGRIVAAVGVDISAGFVQNLQSYRKGIFSFGLLSILLSVVIGFVLAKTITDPIKCLVESATQIGRGNLNRPVVTKSRDELGYLGQAMDKMRKSIMDRDRQLKTMLAAVAHEIRNPLGGIELFAGLAAEELEGKSKGKDHIDKIIREVRNLSRIIDEFLTFARPLNPQRRLALLADLIDEAFCLVSSELEAKGIVFKKELSENQIYVYADPEQVKRALLNLFKNSIQAMEQNGNLIVTGTRKRSRVSIEIKDTGSGIPQGHLERIFDPFFTTRQQGIGLGLSIVKKIVEENGGKISVATKQNHGTTFTILLPGSKPTGKIKDEHHEQNCGNRR
ncbi:MAG: HAMP domain-containing protein [Candidatus Latescibacteria bacterium]|nr:HAMP domain-containing protein [Candidatus Latescibacterota bacterium]